MIRIGVFIRTEDVPESDTDFNTSASSLLLHMAASYGVELFLFSPGDVDLEKNMINGLFIENGKPLRRIVPVPFIIDNKTYASSKCEKTLKIFKTLKERTQFTRPSAGFTKMGQYECILSGNKFSGMVIPALFINNETDMVQIFDTLGDDVILKPNGLSRGIGIVAIKRYGKKFSIIKDNSEVKSLMPPEFKSHIDNIISSSRKYIAQKRVFSMTSFGNPFDIRILIQRRGKNSHSYVMYPRIGGGKLLSNLAAGGSTKPLDTFLEENFGDMAPDVKKELEILAGTFPQYYQGHMKHPLFDLGIDVGIEKTKDSFKLWIFEVNFAPQFAFKDNYAHLHMEITRATLECYHYLNNKAVNPPE